MMNSLPGSVWSFVIVTRANRHDLGSDHARFLLRLGLTSNGDRSSNLGRRI